MQFLGKEGIDVKTFPHSLTYYNEIEKHYKCLEGKAICIFMHGLADEKHLMRVVEITKYNISQENRNAFGLNLEENYTDWFLYELSVEKSFKNAEKLMDVWGIEFSTFNWAVKVQCPECGKEGFISITFSF